MIQLQVTDFIHQKINKQRILEQRKHNNKGAKIYQKTVMQ